MEFELLQQAKVIEVPLPKTDGLALMEMRPAGMSTQRSRRWKLGPIAHEWSINREGGTKADFRKRWGGGRVYAKCQSDAGG
jgi:hypothetical protein